MIIHLIRTVFTDKSTAGVVSVNGLHQCFSLEDICREKPPGTWRKALKVAGKTAIPYGTYEVVVTFSNRFKKPLPLLLGVPDFEGVRIHAGNTSEDTEGCILVGETRSPDFVGNSRAAFNFLFERIREASAVEKVFITIESAFKEKPENGA